VEVENSRRWKFKSGGSKMNTSMQLIQIDRQVWGAKDTGAIPKIPLSVRVQPISKVSDTLLPLCPFASPMLLDTNISLMSLPKESQPSETSSKERALALARKDRSTPINLRLRAGTVKELTEGVFVKKRLNGILEVYISEE
jgi:hypothetical protein